MFPFEPQTMQGRGINVIMSEPLPRFAELFKQQRQHSPGVPCRRFGLVPEIAPLAARRPRRVSLRYFFRMPWRFGVQPERISPPGAEAAAEAGG